MACLLLLLVGVSVQAACVGDCSNGNTVSVDELVTGVNIALGNLTPDQCLAFDCNGTHHVTVDCLVMAVNNALNGCPVGPSPTPTGTVLASASPTPTPTPTGTVLPSASPTPTSTAVVCSTPSPPPGGSILVVENLQVDATNDPLLSLGNLSNSLAHAYCFFVDAACQIRDFTIALPKQSSMQWQASVGGGSAPAVPIPFSGELVCVQVTAEGNPIAGDSLVGNSQKTGQCLISATSTSGFPDANNGDNTLCLDGSAASGICPTAEYDGCPAGVHPGRIEACWSQSRFTFVCAVLHDAK